MKPFLLYIPLRKKKKSPTMPHSTVAVCKVTPLFSLLFSPLSTFLLPSVRAQEQEEPKLREVEANLCLWAREGGAVVGEGG